MSDWSLLETLAARAAHGDDLAWSEFMGELHPLLPRLIRRQRIGRLKARKDDVDNIVVKVFEKLARDERRTLQRYFAMNQRPRFSPWLARVVKSCAIDYMRLHPEYRRPRGDQARDMPSSERWVSLATLTTGVGVPDHESLVEMRQQVVRDIRQSHQEAMVGESHEVARKWRIEVRHVRRLKNKGHLYEPVLELTVGGYSQREIAARLELGRREVEQVLHYLRELLQARYRVDR